MSLQSDAGIHSSDAELAKEAARLAAGKLEIETKIAAAEQQEKQAFGHETEARKAAAVDSKGGGLVGRVHAVSTVDKDKVDLGLNVASEAFLPGIGAATSLFSVVKDLKKVDAAGEALGTTLDQHLFDGAKSKDIMPDKSVIKTAEAKPSFDLACRANIAGKAVGEKSTGDTKTWCNIKETSAQFSQHLKTMVNSQEFGRIKHAQALKHGYAFKLQQAGLGQTTAMERAGRIYTLDNNAMEQGPTPPEDITEA